MNDVTQILSAIKRSDPKPADELLPLVYDELRRLAAQRLAQEKPGLTVEQAAECLGISPKTAERSWRYARAWLYTAMAEPDSGKK